jgi:hypothetical protein
MSRPAGQPVSSIDRRSLGALVRRIARADRHAFTRLYQALAPAVAADLRTMLPRPTDATAITSAVFVEVWWLARFHTTPDADVHAWITGIATRRAGERRSADRVVTIGDTSSGPLCQSPGSIRAVHDRGHELALAALLDHHARASRPARYRTRATNRAQTT